MATKAKSKTMKRRAVADGNARRRRRTTGAAAKPGGPYLGLLKSHPPRPIGSEAELAQVQAIVDRFAHRERLTTDEEDYLCLLGMLIERWETDHEPEIPTASDVEILRHLMEDRGLTQKALAEASGVVNTTISAILAGRRRLNRQHAEAFARVLGIRPGDFLRL